MAKKRHYGKLTSKKLGMLKAGEQAAVYAIIVILLLCFVFGVSKVSGNSMEPTLHNGQPVFYSRLHRNYIPGDIVSVRMPSDEFVVKRVIAVEGDTVDIIDGVLYVNGLPHTQYGSTEKADSTVQYPLTLKQGQLFILGDNREVSVDSRVYGPISKTQTRGRILFVK